MRQRSPSHVSCLNHKHKKMVNIKSVEAPLGVLGLLAALTTQCSENLFNNLLNTDTEINIILLQPMMQIMHFFPTFLTNYT